MRIGVSQILSETFAMVRSRFWSLVGMYFVWFAIMMAAIVVFFLVMGGGVMAMTSMSSAPDSLGAGAGAGFILGALVFYIVYLLLACAQAASMSTLASPLHIGSFGDAFGKGVRAALPLLGVMILFLIGYLVFGFVFGLLAGLLSQGGSAASIIVGLIAFAVVLWLAARLGIVFPIVPVDGVNNPIKAIGRAWSLTSGNALPIFLSFLVFVVIAIVLVGIAIVPFMGTFAALGGGDPGAAMGGAVILMFLAIIAVSLLIGVAYMALISAIHALLAGGRSAAEAFE